MTGFVTAMCVFLFMFILSFFSDFFSNQIHIPAKYQQLEDQAFMRVEEDVMMVEENVMMIEREMNESVSDVLVNNLLAGGVYDEKSEPSLDMGVNMDTTFFRTMDTVSPTVAVMGMVDAVR